MSDRPEDLDTPFLTSTHQPSDEPEIDKPPDGCLMRLGKGCLNQFILHLSILLVLGGAIGLGGSFVFETINRMKFSGAGSIALAVLLVLGWFAVIAVVIKFVGSWGQIILDKLNGER